MRAFRLLSLVGLVAAACSAGPEAAGSGGPEATGQNDARIILSARACPTIDPTKRPCWTPDVQTVDRADRALTSALASYDGRGADAFRAQLPTYTRQYLGVTIDGQRLLMINAFCDAGRSNRRTEVVDVMDGGSCYWQAYYDPGRDSIVRIAVNGEA